MIPILNPIVNSYADSLLSLAQLSPSLVPIVSQAEICCPVMFVWNCYEDMKIAATNLLWPLLLLLHLGHLTAHLTMESQQNISISTQTDGD